MTTAKRKSKYDANIMLDLEFMCTEKDILDDLRLRGSIAQPLVTSIGITVQDEATRKIVLSKLVYLNIQEQLDNGAKFGARCMVDFWSQQPSLGKELNNCFKQTLPMRGYIDYVCNVLQAVYNDYNKVRLIGNNLMADNIKLMNLVQQYGTVAYPVEYHHNFDLQGLKRTAELVGIDTANLGKHFDKIVSLGSYEYFNTPELHNAEYDCHRQLYVMNSIEDMLAYSYSTFRQ